MFVAACSLLFAGSANAGSITNNQQAYWALNDGEGTSIADTTFNVNTGSLSGSEAWTTGQVGGAFHFDGTSNKITVPDAPSLNFTGSFSASFWMNADSWNDGRNAGILSKLGAGNGFVIFDNATSDCYGPCGAHMTLRIHSAYQNQETLFSNATVTPGEWEHWAFVFNTDTDMVQLYKNGILDKEYTNIQVSDLTNLENFVIGQSQPSADYFDGILDEVHLYNRAISSAEVFHLFHGDATFAGGDGTSETPYQIATCTQLAGVDQSLAAYYILTSDLDCSAENNSIVIGSHNDPFTGNFNGNGHTITTHINTYGDRVGLFAETSGATISNVRVIGSVAGGRYVGGLIGTAGAGTTISNVAISADVTGTSYSMSYQIGGIAGELLNSSITNSYYFGRVTSINNLSDIGGLAGAALGTAVVDHSYSAGKVTGGTGTGGLVGRVYGTTASITNNFSVMRVASNWPSYSGGLVGWASDLSDPSSILSNNAWDIRRTRYTYCTSNAGGSPVYGAFCTGVDANSTDRSYFVNTSTNGVLASWDFDSVWNIQADGYPILQAIVSDEHPLTLYWYQATESSSWDTLGNWWQDAAHTIPATALPGSFTTVITLGSTGPVTDTYVWTEPEYIDATVTGVTFTTSDLYHTGYIYNDVVGNASFYGASNIGPDGALLGDAVLHESASILGSVTGTVQFYDNSSNNGTVHGNTTFHDLSYQSGTVYGDTHFYDSSFSDGTMVGNVFYHNHSYGYSSYIEGNATFATDGFSGTTIPTAGSMLFLSQNWTNTVSGTLYGSDDEPLTHFTFQGQTNLSTIAGDVTFTGAGYNNGTITGTSTFNNTSYNNAIVIGNVTFNNTAQNSALGTITGNVTLNNKSKNLNLITGNVTLNGTSENVGSVIGDAYVACGATNSGSVSGTITHQSCSIIAAYESNDRAVTPVSPGTATNARYTFDEDQQYLITSLSQTMDGYDTQVFKVQPDLDGAVNPRFTVTWKGHGDTHDKQITMALWNQHTATWDAAANNTCADDCTISGYLTGTNYLDEDGVVWVRVKAINYYNPPVVSEESVTSNGGLLPIQWTTDVGGTSLVAYDTVSHSIGTWEDYASHATDTTLGTSHTVSLSLVNGTTYYFRVRSTNESGDYSTSTQEYSFTYSSGSSCPFLFSYDGSRYNFIVDASSPSSLARGIRRELWQATPFFRDPATVFPMPQAYVGVDPDKLTPRTVDGETFYDIKAATELNEVNYFDALSLITIDHSTSMFAFPDYRNNGQIHTIQKDAPAPVSVTDQDGRSVLSKVSANDNEYWLAPAQTPRDFLTIKLSNDPTTPAHLKLAIKRGKQGNVSGTSSDVLQYKNPSGTFVPVPADIDPFTVTRPGAPHSSANTVNTYGVETKVIDLSGLTIRDNEIRLVSNSNQRQWDIDWLAVDTSADEAVTTSTLNPYYADLHARGVSRLTNTNPSDSHMTIQEPVYSDLARTVGQGNTLTGNATRFGDVAPLLTDADNKFVIMVQGDEMALRFTVPTQATGTERNFAIYTWDYHKSFRNALGDTIEPLPFNEMTRYPYRTSEEHYPTSTEFLIYQATYNTRAIDWVADDEITGEHHSVNTDILTMSVSEGGPVMTLSDPAITPSTSTAHVTWTTGSATGTSSVTYSPDFSYASTTPETDTGEGMTTDHAVTITNLVPCTHYNVIAHSTNGSGSTGDSDTASFTTLGCTGGALPLGSHTATADVSATSTSSLTTSGNTLTVTAPPDFTDATSSIVIQIRSLDATTVLGILSKPSSSLNSGASVVFDVKALIDSSTLLDSFNVPVTITYHYSTSDIAGLDESSLWMYHYHAGSWIALDHCSIDTEENVITCTAPNFSVFSLFGTPTTASTPVVSGGGGGGGGSIATYGCTDARALNFNPRATNQSFVGECQYAGTPSSLLPISPIPVSIVSPSSSTSNVTNASTTPVVRSPETQLACTSKLDVKKSVRLGAKNDPAMVRLLERYLNTYEGANLPIDGIYSPKDRDAVVKWQEKYAAEILKPWGIKKGTGYVFTTSLKKMEQIHEKACTVPKPKAKPVPKVTAPNKKVVMKKK